MSSKGTMKPQFETSLDVLDFTMKSKKKVSVVFKGSFETFTRYSGVDGEEQKKFLIFKSNFSKSLVRSVHSFFYL